MAWNARQQVEIFHVLFLRALFSKLPDKTLIAVKGGCNLRLFFKSPRYSEDLDLDAHTIAPATLRSKVDRILTEPALTNVLKGHAVQLLRVSTPKQTDLVQRWKISVAGADGTETPTKVEFSHRDSAVGVSEAIDDGVLEKYNLPKPILVTHYAKDVAAQQKVLALVGRSEPQTRDVFDLSRLLSLGARIPAVGKGTKKAAIEKTHAFSFDEFQSQVVAYLEPDEQPVYDEKAAWEEIQLLVAEAIDAAPTTEEAAR